MFTLMDGIEKISDAAESSISLISRGFRAIGSVFDQFLFQYGKPRFYYLDSSEHHTVYSDFRDIRGNFVGNPHDGKRHVISFSRYTLKRNRKLLMTAKDDDAVLVYDTTISQRPLVSEFKIYDFKTSNCKLNLDESSIRVGKEEFDVLGTVRDSLVGPIIMKINTAAYEGENLVSRVHIFFYNEKDAILFKLANPYT